MPRKSGKSRASVMNCRVASHLGQHIVNHLLPCIGPGLRVALRVKQLFQILDKSVRSEQASVTTNQGTVAIKRKEWNVTDLMFEAYRGVPRLIHPAQKCTRAKLCILTNSKNEAGVNSVGFGTASALDQ